VRFPSRREIWLFIRLTRPHFLVGSLLTFGLGASIASYLGHPISTKLYLLGQAAITAAHLMNHFLNEFHDFNEDQLNLNRTILSGGSGALGEGGFPPKVALYASFVSMTILASVVGALLLTGQVSVVSWLILIMIVLGAYFYNVPPVRLVSSGYGEFIAALIVCGLVPAFSFSLQAGSVHLQVLLATFPLVSANYAMLLTVELPDYATDLKVGKSNIMVRLGWRKGMWLHDAALLLAFLGLGMGYMLGLPYKVAVGPLIALPLAVAQVWTLWRIRSGSPPRWTILTASALVILGLMIYLELAGYLLN
jgi:1,4-dihydroxy-2-naphthoate octaprenyltransferase